jgi:putative sporulation protein YyaC
MNLKQCFNKNNESLRMLHTDPMLHKELNEKIISWLPPFPREYIVVFIGTDRSTGDALGPLAGTFLSEMQPKHVTIYGTLHEPVHATNLKAYVKHIKANHKWPFIIAVDACLGKDSSIGQLIAGVGPLKPGAALNKPLPSIGDIHLTGVVNISGWMEYSILQNTRLSIVFDMAYKIANILAQVDQQLKYNYALPPIILRKDLPVEESL